MTKLNFHQNLTGCYELRHSEYPSKDVKHGIYSVNKMPANTQAATGPEINPLIAELFWAQIKTYLNVISFFQNWKG